MPHEHQPDWTHEEMQQEVLALRTRLLINEQVLGAVFTIVGNALPYSRNEIENCITQWNVTLQDWEAQHPEVKARNDAMRDTLKAEENKENETNKGLN